MIKVEANQDFSLSEFSKVKNLKRKGREKANFIFKGDIFECNKEFADYLIGNNPKRIKVVDIIEIIPEEKKEEKPKTTKKKSSTKKKNML